MSSAGLMRGRADRAIDAGLRPFPGLFGLQIFVVEDELLVAAMLEDMLAEFGCIVAGAATSLHLAIEEAITAEVYDAAILDVRLRGELIFPVADLLIERGVPVVFSTGFGAADLRQRYPQSRVLHKPYAPEALAEVLTQIVRDRLH